MDATPAFTLQLQVGYRALEKLPPEPAYNRTILFEGDAIIKPEPREDAFYAEMHYGIDLTVEEIAALKEGKAWLWLYCSLTYRDFIGIKEKRFCWRWAQRPTGDGVRFWVMDGQSPPAYTQSDPI